MAALEAVGLLVLITMATTQSITVTTQSTRVAADFMNLIIITATTQSAEATAQSMTMTEPMTLVTKPFTPHTDGTGSTDSVIMVTIRDMASTRGQPLHGILGTISHPADLALPETPWHQNLHQGMVLQLPRR